VRPSLCSPTVFAIDVYAMADKYDVEPLKDLAIQQLRAAFGPLNIVRETAALIETLRAIHECTAPTDTKLWEIVYPKLIANINALTENEDFFALLQDMPVLMKKLLRRNPKLFAAPIVGQAIALKPRRDAVVIPETVFSDEEDKESMVVEYHTDEDENENDSGCLR
jgi:hypothetical protein